MAYSDEDEYDISDGEDDIISAIIDSPKDVPYDIRANDITVKYVPGSYMRSHKEAFYKDDDGVYYLRRFDDCAISTITAVTHFDTKLNNIREIAHILPIKMVKDKRKKCPPGSIISARLPPFKEKSPAFEPMIRGLHGGTFRNSLILDIWIPSKKKPMSTKLTLEKIHICGCLNMNMAEEVTHYMVEMLNETDKFVRKLHKYPEAFNTALDWIIVRSTEKTKSYQEEPSFSEDDMIIYIPKPDQVVFKGIPDEDEDINPMVRYFIEQIQLRTEDISLVSKLLLRINYIMSIERIFETKKLGFKYITRSMYNIGHQISENIDRQLVATKLTEYGFRTEYINTGDSHIFVILTSKFVEDNENITRRKGKEKNQRIRIYAGGKITHSAAGGKPMEDAHIRFMLSMINIMDGIEREKTN